MHYSVSAVNFFNHNIIAMITEVWVGIVLGYSSYVNKLHLYP